MSNIAPFIKSPHPAFGHLLPCQVAREKVIIIKCLLPSEGWESEPANAEGRMKAPLKEVLP